MADEGESRRGETTVRVWHLEMTSSPTAGSSPMAGSSPAAEPTSPAGDALGIRRVEVPDLESYRSLYIEVGEPWQWFVRRLLDDDSLADILLDPRNELWHLLRGNRPIGFAELDLRGLPDVELVYFGLVPAAVGTGAGPWFLRSMVHEIWRRPETGRLWLHTCELDHPRALDFYRRHGFRVFKEVREAGPGPAQERVW